MLDIKDDKVLVISKYALDRKQYNTEYTDVTWETFTLRKWQNNEFTNTAFSSDKKEKISVVTISTDENPEYNTNSGNAIQDQVFLLSITEANTYFNSESTRMCEATNYAVAKGAYVNFVNDNCWWWLRSPGYFQDVAAFVGSGGNIIERGFVAKDDVIAVRPALWINLNA